MSVHIHGKPTGAAAVFMMRPTTAPSASTSKSSSFHWPDGREAEARVRISEDTVRSYHILLGGHVPLGWCARPESAHRPDGGPRTIWNRLPCHGQLSGFPRCCCVPAGRLPVSLAPVS